jgi:GntR family transcriptional regulator
MASGSVLPAVLDGPVPKHLQLRSILLARIHTELAPDAPIPSERELMVRFGVSRATVREAIGQLCVEGRLYRVRGKGTFVAPPRAESQLHLSSFTEEMRARGHVPTTVVLAASEQPAPTQAAASLRIGVGDKVYRLERLRIADSVPMALEIGWYPQASLPDLLDRDLAGSLYSLLADTYGFAVDSAEQTVWAEPAGPQRGRLLRIDPHAPLLAFRKTSYAGAVPIEHMTSWYRADRYQVHMSLHRPGEPEHRPPHSLAGGTR